MNNEKWNIVDEDTTTPTLREAIALLEPLFGPTKFPSFKIEWEVVKEAAMLSEKKEFATYNSINCQNYNT